MLCTRPQSFHCPIAVLAYSLSVRLLSRGLPLVLRRSSGYSASQVRILAEGSKVERQVQG